jgi:hypothetical protein
MAQFPISDQQGIVDGLNYVLSGPVSSGVDVEGVSTDQLGYLTGNFRQPFTSTSGNLYVNPITLSTSEWLDSRTWKFTFASAEPTPPFVNGNNIDVVGVTPSDYDGYYAPIGVVSCTTTYVIARTASEYPDPGVVGSGGTVSLSIVTDDSDVFYSTDANAKVTVTGGTDRVFLTAQINNTFQYASNAATTMQYTVAINRYAAFPNNDVTNPDFLFDGPTIVSKQTYLIDIPATGTGAETFTITAGTGTSGVLQRTYFIPNATTTVGTGSGVNLNITLAPGIAGAYTTANTLIEIADDAGEAYTVGDTIVIPGDQLGGATPTNDLTIDVATVQADYVETNNPIETIFTTVIDDPDPGYYWYILELQWYVPAGTLIINQSELNFRSLSAQVVKQ